MVIAAVLCLCAAVAVAVAGLWLLRRPRPGQPVRQELRAVAPTQLAAAVMLAAGGAVALAAQPGAARFVLIVCVIGAVGTVAVGCWQSARQPRATRQRLVAAAHVGHARCHAVKALPANGFQFRLMSTG